MVAFLSSAWIDALATAAAAAPKPDVASVVAVEVVVEGAAPDPAAPAAAVGDAAWHLVAAPDGMRVAPGRLAGALVTLTADVATASELAQGRANAQRALDEGRLRLRGDLADLAKARVALDALGDVFASVRAATEFPPAN